MRLKAKENIYTTTRLQSFISHILIWTPQKFARSPFFYVLQENKMNRFEADFSGKTSVPNFVKFFQELKSEMHLNPYPTAFPYGNGMVLHFYQQQESSTTKTVHKVINKGLKTYV